MSKFLNTININTLCLESNSMLIVDADRFVVIRCISDACDASFNESEVTTVLSGVGPHSSVSKQTTTKLPTKRLSSFFLKVLQEILIIVLMVYGKNIIIKYEFLEKIIHLKLSKCQKNIECKWFPPKHMA